MKASKKTKWIISILFALYMVVLLRLTVFRGSALYAEPQLNLSLFANLIQVWRDGGFWEFSRQFFGNIGWFVPFGFLLPFLLRRTSLLLVTAMGAGLSLAIELAQYIFRVGVAELDDLILNTLGVVIGYLFYKLLGMITAKAKD